MPPVLFSNNIQSDCTIGCKVFMFKILLNIKNLIFSNRLLFLTIILTDNYQEDTENHIKMRVKFHNIIIQR